jgi:deazaflavin-dependent oxidoreductase (nitroreductase family)
MTMTSFGDRHVADYRASDGASGYVWRNGTTILLLTTIGNKTGNPRTVPLIYREWDGAYLIVASKGGTDVPPAWYLNLSAHPNVSVQIKDEVFSARARTASAEERAKMWPHMTQVWPDYDEYQKKTDREIPIVVLERTE